MIVTMKKTIVKRIEKQEIGIETLRQMRGLGFEVEEIDGKEPVDFCEVCGGPIFDAERCHRDEEGVAWHVNCPEEFKA